MPDMEFTQEDIDGLVQKVATLAPDLDESERVLLLAIFAMAAEHAKPSRPGRATLPQPASLGEFPQEIDESADQATLADLRQELLNAYITGNSFDSVIPHIDVFSIHEIGIRPPPPPPPPPPPSTADEP
jgi:hypothetical protein